MPHVGYMLHSDDIFSLRIPASPKIQLTKLQIYGVFVFGWGPMNHGPDTSHLIGITQMRENALEGSS